VTDGEQGPDHEKEFEVYVEIESEILARGKGLNKKSAEQNAAQNALQIIEVKFEKKTEEKI
jgi:ribonuclease-3